MGAVSWLGGRRELTQARQERLPADRFCVRQDRGAGRRQTGIEQESELLRRIGQPADELERG